VEYGQIPGIGKRVSRLAQGTVMIASTRMEESCALLDAVFALGCTTFDTAHLYGRGDNERTFGHWMTTRGNREEVVLIGKGAHHSQDRKRCTPFDIAADLHDSLARLKTDYIDLYLLHRDDPAVPVGPIVEALNEHRAAGRIHAFGGSNWSSERVRAANEYAEAHGLVPFAAGSPNFSLAEQVAEPWAGCVTISGPDHAADRERYAETQLPLFTWSSLAGGFFSGRLTRANAEEMKETLSASTVHAYYDERNFRRLDRAQELAKEKDVTVPQIALAYVMNQQMNIFALVAAYRPEEFQANIEACDLKLTEAEMAWLDLRSEER